jgi:pre-rRNA-processing protein TSR1
MLSLFPFHRSALVGLSASCIVLPFLARWRQVVLLVFQSPQIFLARSYGIERRPIKRCYETNILVLLTAYRFSHLRSLNGTVESRGAKVSVSGPGLLRRSLANGGNGGSLAVCQDFHPRLNIFARRIIFSSLDITDCKTIDKVATIPFRPKASGGMAPIPDSHHHRSTSKVPHKPFKSRHASKGLLKKLSKGKIEDGGIGSRKTPHQQVMSKIDRRHQARQLRQLKHQDNLKSSSVFSGQHGAPRIVAVVPLCRDTDPKTAVWRLSQDGDKPAEMPLEGPFRIRVDKFKQNVIFVTVGLDLISALDACRVADCTIFLLSPTQEVDEEGEMLLRAIEGQGLSDVFTMVQGLDKLEPPKRRPQAAASLKSYITHFLPSTNVMRSLCTANPRGVKWRDDRSWMLVESVEWHKEGSPLTTQGEVVIAGVVRGRGLQANRLVQVGDWGCFQIDKITAATLPASRKRKADEMAIDIDPTTEHVLEIPDEEQDDLAELAPYDATMNDIGEIPTSEAPTERRGVLLDDHHYFSEDETHLPDIPKHLPRGTSSYQSAWFLGDVSDTDSDVEDVIDDDEDMLMDTPALAQDGIEGLNHFGHPEPTETTPSEYPQTEMFLDPSPDEEAAQLAAYRRERKKEANDDLEFPDEIELHPHVLARERLTRYRGLKSLRTSTWETEEDAAHEPDDWNRLLQIPKYKQVKKIAIREALVGGVKPGQRVNVHLRSVPLSFKKSYDIKKPLILFSLLRHEQKRTMVNFSMTLSSDHPGSIRSKDQLILQCGPRRLVINPLFSQTGSTANNVHKFLRYLHPGQTAMASFIAPVTWGALPALFFQETTNPQSDDLAQNEVTSSPRLKLIGTGTSQAPDRSRVIAKRIILTGHPYKIHKKLVTVRYMFFNKEDVNWFKALPLWTKRGRSGYIKESLGTHGYFKATFDGKINPQDAVGVSLYKRVFPRNATAWRLDQAI